jgi:signal transduction histidine kinase
VRFLISPLHFLFLVLTLSVCRTEFLTTVSHEIRTPIASILGICELLLAEEMPSEQRQLVKKALQSGENLLELVGTVLVRFLLSSLSFLRLTFFSPTGRSQG